MSKDRDGNVTLRPINTLYNQIAHAISDLHSLPRLQWTRRFQRYLDRIGSLTATHFPSFQFPSPLYDSLVTLRNIVLTLRHNEQRSFFQQRKDAWRDWVHDTWSLNSKQIYQLVKGKPRRAFYVSLS